MGAEFFARVSKFLLPTTWYFLIQVRRYLPKTALERARDSQNMGIFEFFKLLVQSSRRELFTTVWVEKASEKAQKPFLRTSANKKASLDLETLKRSSTTDWCSTPGLLRLVDPEAKRKLRR